MLSLTGLILLTVSEEVLHITMKTTYDLKQIKRTYNFFISCWNEMCFVKWLFLEV